MESKIAVVRKSPAGPHVPVYGSLKRSTLHRSSLRVPRMGKAKEIKRNESWKKIAKEKSFERIFESEFQPEIQLKNRIIEQLTKEYETKLKPIPRKKSHSNNHSLKNCLDNFSPEAGVVNVAFEDSPVGVSNPGFVASPTGVANLGFEDSPVHGLSNEGFSESPEVETNQAKQHEEDVRSPDSTPRKSRADRHKKRWVSEELDTLYEEDENVVDCDEIPGENRGIERKVSLAEFFPREKPKEGSMAKKFLRVGSLRGPRTRGDKLKRVSSIVSINQLSGVAGETSDDQLVGTRGGQPDRAMDFWVDNFKITARKKLEKISKINIHLHALFSAVEHGQVDKVRTILDTTEVDINGLNNDHLTPLDVALLTNQKAVAKLLIGKGARPNQNFETPEKLSAHLRALLQDCEQRLSDLIPSETLNNNGNIRGISQTNLSQPTSNSTTTDKEKELLFWEKRSALLKKMLLGFKQARPPDMPSLVSLDVRSTTEVSVRFQLPESQESGLCTRIKVQWSCTERFEDIAGELETWDVKESECRVSQLTQGTRYWFRASFANVKGYGLWRPSTPASVIPSSWRDAEKSDPRFSLCLLHLEDLFADVKQLKPDSACEVKDFPEQEKAGETPALPRRNVKKKTTIKQLFTATGKFHKNLKRGVFLSTLFYHEDKVLITNEDFLPCVEIDETYPSAYHNDLHWLMKVAATWDDVKNLRQDMERHLTSTTSHFRIKLLQAAQQMQSAMNTDDLGQLHYQPVRDEQGTMVLTTVRFISNPKSISVLNLRWVPLSKLQKKFSVSPDTESSAAELIMSSIQSQISHHQSSNVKLSRGLYLGYLKLRSSVDLIHIIVSQKSPNVLPSCKVRDNPHVSLEEWEWLKRISARHKVADAVRGGRDGTEQQIIFLEQVASTARRLFSYMEVPLDEAMCHRVYDLEVVELSPDVSLLVVVPPAEACCSAPGQEESILSRTDLMGVSIQVFEMMHLTTYQHDIITRYSRLSCILELYLILAQHSQREAFSTSEVAMAKERLGKLQNIQIQLNAVWKSVRWIMDVITFTRDRAPANNGVPVSHLLSLTKKSKCLKENHGFTKQGFLQPPVAGDHRLARANLTRGSWSGSTLPTTQFPDAMSRSEQRLDKLPPEKPPVITCTRVTNRLPSSRSEDQLGPPLIRPATTSVSATNSPLLMPRHLNASHTSDSLRSVSSDESTAAVVSLPVTTPHKFPSFPSSPDVQECSFAPYRAVHSPSSDQENRVKSPLSSPDSVGERPLQWLQDLENYPHRASSSPGSPLRSFAPPLRAGSPSFPSPMRPSSSLLSLAKPALTDKRTSLLSGNAIPVNIPLRCVPAFRTTNQLSPTMPPAVEDEDDKVDDDAGVKVPIPSSGVLQVYAAYDTGLAPGTSLQLHVTPRTSAREVVDLVVKQLNMAVLLKGRDKPIYSQDQLSQFCLVAVIGARERCLRDDFKPLQLQNPWKKGRLYVRQKQDVLAALEYSARQTAFL